MIPLSGVHCITFKLIFFIRFRCLRWPKRRSSVRTQRRLDVPKGYGLLRPDPVPRRKDERHPRSFRVHRFLHSLDQISTQRLIIPSFSTAFLGSCPNSKIMRLKGGKIHLFCGMGKTLLSWCRFSSFIMFGVCKRKVQKFQYTMMFIGIYLPLSF